MSESLAKLRRRNAAMAALLRDLEWSNFGDKAEAIYDSIGKESSDWQNTKDAGAGT